jgi:hypothetical protein
MAGLHLTAGAIGGLLLAGSLGALALAAAGTAVTRFRWDPSRPRHARTAGAPNPARSG